MVRAVYVWRGMVLLRREGSGLETERQVEELLKVVVFDHYQLRMVDVPELMYWLPS